MGEWGGEERGRWAGCLRSHTPLSQSGAALRGFGKSSGIGADARGRKGDGRRGRRRRQQGHGSHKRKGWPPRRDACAVRVAWSPPRVGAAPGQATGGVRAARGVWAARSAGESAAGCRPGTTALGWASPPRFPSPYDGTARGGAVANRGGSTHRFPRQPRPGRSPPRTLDNSPYSQFSTFVAALGRRVASIHPPPKSGHPRTPVVPARRQCPPRALPRQTTSGRRPTTPSFTGRGRRCWRCRCHRRHAVARRPLPPPTTTRAVLIVRGWRATAGVERRTAAVRCPRHRCLCCLPPFVVGGGGEGAVTDRTARGGRPPRTSHPLLPLPPPLLLSRQMLPLLGPSQLLPSLPAPLTAMPIDCSFPLPPSSCRPPRLFGQSMQRTGRRETGWRRLFPPPPPLLPPLRP